MVLVLTSYDFASRRRHDVSKWCHFLRKMEISIYTFTRSGIMENWIKHEYFYFNNEILRWHDATHDNMSSHDIRDMTSRHDFIISISWIFDFFYISQWVNWSDYFTFVSHVIQVKRYILRIAVCVTFTRDLETEGNVMVYVTLIISTCICPTAMIVCCFVRLFRSRNSFWLLPLKWLLRMAL